MSWFKNSINKNKMLKTLIGISSVALIGTSAILLTSCSSNKSGLTTKDLVSTGTGDYYAINSNNNLNIKLSPKEIFEEALRTRTPIEKIFRNKLGEQCYQIIQKIIEISNIERYKYDLAEQRRKIDSDYTKLVDNLKSSNPNDWEIVLQKDTLDPNGGTADVYKNNQLLEWSITYLTSKIFERSYLKVYDSSSKNYLSTPTKQQILDASNNSNNLSFQFWADYNDTVSESKTVENFFASIQAYVFNLWMKIEQPFVVNMSLWKYGTPKNGIDKFYNIQSSSSSDDSSGDSSSDSSGDSSGDSNSSTSSSSSYSFPYFQNGTYDATNDTLTTVDKFINFVNASKTNNNFKNTSSNIGLIDIPQEFTEDSSTYILAKRSSIFSDLYPEFAAASMSLFTNQTNTFSKNVNATKNTFNEFDTITANFVSNNTISSTHETTISAEVVNDIIKEDGNYKGYRGKSLYSIDAFKSSDNNLNQFMFLRNSAGVHAIAIDGGESFISESNFNTKISKMKVPILYRSMMSSNQYQSLDNPVFSLDLNSSLKSFLDSNLNMIMLSLVNDTINDFTSDKTNDFTSQNNNKNSLKEYITENKFKASDAENNLYNEWQEIQFISSSITNYETVKDKMISTKETYNANYGTQLPNNGLASRWIYEQEANGIFKINKEYENVFGQSISSSTLDAKIKTFNETTIKSYISNMESAGSFSKKTIKYSQQIWTQNNDVNAVNYDYTKNNTNLQTFIVNQVLENSSKNLATFNISNTNNIITLNNTDNLSALGSDLQQTQSELIQRIANDKLFALSNDKKFDKYNLLMNKNDLSISDINEYAKKLLLEDVNSNSENQLNIMKSLYTSVLTLNYVLKNNGQNFLDYVKTKVNFGDDAYIVWTDTFNSKYDTLGNTTTSDTLNANGGARLISNIDNSLNGMYSSQNSNTLSNSSATGTNQTSLYGVSSSHFNIKENMFGYLGLQNESSNSLSSTTVTKLFNKNRETNKNGTAASSNEIYQGLLYKYGSKQSLVDKIKDMSNWSQLEELISNIQKEIPIFDMDQITNAKLDEVKKIFLGDNLDGNSGIINQIPSEAFQKYEGQLTINPYYESVGTSTVKNATYVKQINYEDLNADSLTNLKSKIGDTLFYDLLISAALDSNNQTYAINEISRSNKFTIYDINVKNALGEKWVSNWKLPNGK